MLTYEDYVATLESMTRFIEDTPTPYPGSDRDLIITLVEIEWYKISDMMQPAFEVQRMMHLMDSSIPYPFDR